MIENLNVILIEKLFKNVKLISFFSIFLLQLSPWLAVEIPDLIEKGIVTYQEKSES